MKVAVPKERDEDERRVALVPDTAKKLIAAGLEVSVEEGAGSAAFLSDADYETAGVKVVKGARPAPDADVVLKVQASHFRGRPDPQGRRAHQLSAACDAGRHHRRPAAGSHLVQFELVPRISRAQSMDALVAGIGGGAAVLLWGEPPGKFS